MSTYFSKLVKAGDQVREFNFKLAALNDDTRYIIDVPDDGGKRIVFSAFKNADGKWQVAAELMPLWIQDAEALLGEAIEENKKAGLLLSRK